MQETHSVEIVQARGMTVMGRAKGTNTWLVMDGPYKFRGSEAGIRPMEAFLVSLGGCTAMDVISLMDKMKVPYRKMKIDMDYERKDEHPKVYTKIHLKYVIFGDITDEKDLKNIEKAINLSQEKYCSVSAMVKAAGIELTHEYKILDSEEAEMPEIWE